MCGTYVALCHSRVHCADCVCELLESLRAHPEDVFCFVETPLLAATLPFTYNVEPDTRYRPKCELRVCLLFNATGSSSQPPIVVTRRARHRPYRPLFPDGKPVHFRQTRSGELTAECFTEYMDTFNMDRFGHNNTAIVLVASAAHVSLDPACDESTMFKFRVQQLPSTKIVHLAGVVSPYNLLWFNGVVEMFKTIFRSRYLAFIIKDSAWLSHGAMPIIAYENVLLWVGSASDCTPSRAVHLSWAKSGMLPMAWRPLLHLTENHATCVTVEPLITQLVRLQQMINKFTKGDSGIMQAPDYAACDTRILAIIGRGTAVADNSAEDLTVLLSMPPGPSLHDPRSRRRVVRAVMQTSVRTAAEMGIPPRDLPERTGLSNDDVINRLRRTPPKRPRLGNKRLAVVGAHFSAHVDANCTMSKRTRHEKSEPDGGSPPLSSLADDLIERMRTKRPGTDSPPPADSDTKRGILMLESSEGARGRAVQVVPSTVTDEPDDLIRRLKVPENQKAFQPVMLYGPYGVGCQVNAQDAITTADGQYLADSIVDFHNILLNIRHPVLPDGKTWFPLDTKAYVRHFSLVIAVNLGALTRKMSSEGEEAPLSLIHYDSHGMHTRTPEVIEGVKKTLFLLHKARRPTADHQYAERALRGAKRIVIQREVIPQQANDTDCDVFVCMYLHGLVNTGFQTVFTWVNYNGVTSRTYWRGIRRDVCSLAVGELFVQLYLEQVEVPLQPTARVGDEGCMLFPTEDEVRTDLSKLFRDRNSTEVDAVLLAAAVMSIASASTQGGTDVNTQGHVSNTVKPNTPDATPVKGRRAGLRMQKTTATRGKASGAGGVGKRGGSSEYTGVWFDLRVRKWCVKIVAEPSTGKQVRLGAYMDEKDAAYAYAAGAFVIRRKDHFPKVMALTDAEMAALEGAIVDDVRHLVQKRQWYRWREWREAMNDIGVLPGTPFKPEPGAESPPLKVDAADSETRTAEADEDLVSKEDSREQDSDGGIECTQAQ
ncbi:unnamed protein product [Closterium sp. Yama58-4]|nr:unnamed protein product [Closterium sp. Yama58-4]